MSQPATPRRAWTQHVISPFTHADRRPSQMEPAGDGIPLAHISEAQRPRILNMLEACREHVRERLDLGAIGWEADGRRHVRVWDLIDVSVALDGSDMRAECLENEPGMGRVPVRADLSVPIGSARWYVAFDPILFSAARRTGVAVGMLAGGPQGTWARYTLRRTFRRYVDWNRLRRAVLDHLAPEPLTISLMHRIFPRCAPQVPQFNWVHRHSRELACVAIESPRLLPFLQLVAWEELETPLPALETALRHDGITPSARRKLELWGWNVFEEATDAVLFCDAKRVVARLANALARLQVDGEPPAMFGALAFADSYRLHPDWFLRALLGEMRRLDCEGAGGTAPDLYAEAFEWVRDRPGPPDHNQARSGWRWIEAQACAHAAALDEEAHRPWRVPCEDFDAGRWRVVAIRNRLELQKEARAMHNCLDGYEPDCRGEVTAIYSVRDRASGQRAACFALELDFEHGAWRLGQVAGKRNAAVAAELADLAVAALARCRPPPRFERA